MFLHERLEKLTKEVMELEGEFLETEPNTDEEERIECVLNDLEIHIQEIENILED